MQKALFTESTTAMNGSVQVLSLTDTLAPGIEEDEDS